MSVGLIIKKVIAESIAAELGILEGDSLLEINGGIVHDVIDYAYYMADENLLLLMADALGEQYEADIEKFAYEDIGIEFEQDGLGKKRICRNKCLFCFVEQMPRGMRKTLYVKDDDWRLSFLMGSYITLTNLSEDEIGRILQQKISPLYISVHASDDDLRVKLLGTERARGSFDLIKRFAAGGIAMNTQIVMCEGLNDAEQLSNTIEALYALSPRVESVAVVPAGLTGHRRGLYPLEPISKNCARDAIFRIEEFQRKYLSQMGGHFVFASDEMYIRAEKELPSFEEYEDFAQIENGVGLVAKFLNEVKEAIDCHKGSRAKSGRFDVITGIDALPYILEMAQQVSVEFGAEIFVHAVKNKFLGESITVTGLITGGDIVSQLGGQALGEVHLPRVCFRENTDCMLDGITLDVLAERLGAECQIVDVDGYSFVESFLELLDMEEING